jgi:hypothetical protein
MHPPTPTDMRTSFSDGAIRTMLLASVIVLFPLTALAQGSPQYTSVVGGAGGTAYTLDCGPGKLLTGLRGRAGMNVDAVGVLCAPVLANGALGSTSAVGSIKGGSGGQSMEIRCATGSVVTSLNVNYGTVLNQIKLRCHQWSSAERRFTGYGTYPSDALGVPRSVDHSMKLECAAGVQPGAGIRGRSGWIVDAIGLICDEP